MTNIKERAIAEARRIWGAQNVETQFPSNAFVQETVFVQGAIWAEDHQNSDFSAIDAEVCRRFDRQEYSGAAIAGLSASFHRGATWAQSELKRESLSTHFVGIVFNPPEAEGSIQGKLTVATDLESMKPQLAAAVDSANEDLKQELIDGFEWSGRYYYPKDTDDYGTFAWAQIYEAPLNTPISFSE